jgi:hypothetical protein
MAATATGKASSRRSGSQAGSGVPHIRVAQHHVGDASGHKYRHSPGQVVEHRAETLGIARCGPTNSVCRGGPEHPARAGAEVAGGLHGEGK